MVSSDWIQEHRSAWFHAKHVSLLLLLFYPFIQAVLLVVGADYAAQTYPCIFKPSTGPNEKLACLNLDTKSGLLTMFISCVASSVVTAASKFCLKIGLSRERISRLGAND